MIELNGRRALFISYNGMLDPLGQSQVIPYLRELSTSGVLFTLLSFERPQSLDDSKVTELNERLSHYNIDWHWLRYHRKPSLPATMYDVLAGTRLARKLVRQNRIELVHARSHIPATIALALKREFKLKMIFDIRGLMADEYVDAGHWRKGSVPYRLTKNMERRALAAADGVVTLTERIWPIISEWQGLRGRGVVHEVVPCCVDLDIYKFDSEARARRRAEIGIGSRFTIVYSGSIDGWYLTEKMADFFATVFHLNPNSFFLWLTQGSAARIKNLMSLRSIPESSYTVKAAIPTDVPSYLSAADAGLAFIKPCFSKLASSPTKYAEYLACGLPLIINNDIGDSDSLVTEDKAGTLITKFSEDEYRERYLEVLKTVESGPNLRDYCRRIADNLFDVRKLGAERYKKLYQALLS